MKPIFLASASPRRHEILSTMRLSHTVFTADADESVPQGTPPKEAGSILAAKKALAVKNALTAEGRFTNDTIIIAADTLVYIDDTPLGKPSSKEDAVKMLCTLSGRTHSVCTGTCIICGSRSISTAETSDVFMRKFSKEDAEKYVQTGEPLDKAGAYGIQGIGAVLVDKIEGDFFSVMGLSPKTVCSLLEKLGLSYFDIIQEN